METDFSMNDATSGGLVRGTVSHNGRRVMLEAEPRGERWQLRIIGSAGRVCECQVSFDSVAEAIITGLAVLQAGIGEFGSEPQHN